MSLTKKQQIGKLATLLYGFYDETYEADYQRATNGKYGQERGWYSFTSVPDDVDDGEDILLDVEFLGATADEVIADLRNQLDSKREAEEAIEEQYKAQPHEHYAKVEQLLELLKSVHDDLYCKGIQYNPELPINDFTKNDPTLKGKPFFTLVSGGRSDPYYVAMYSPRIQHLPGTATHHKTNVFLGDTLNEAMNRVQALYLERLIYKLYGAQDPNFTVSFVDVRRDGTVAPGTLCKGELLHNGYYVEFQPESQIRQCVYIYLGQHIEQAINYVKEGMITPIPEPAIELTSVLICRQEAYSDQADLPGDCAKNITFDSQLLSKTTNNQSYHDGQY